MFIHLFGNHWEYKNRYPSAYAMFSDSKNSRMEGVVDEEKLNEYDNSILYNDYVVSQIFDYAKENWKIMNITYFSDHGEAVVSDKKHIPGYFEQDMATIPVWFYFSDKYFEVYSREKFFIKEDAYFTNDMIYDTLIGIWRINTGYYDSRQDIFSLDYAYKKSDLKILDKSDMIK